MRAKDAVGAYGERVAARHLTEAGLVVLDRNWRCAHGELDIVARDGPTLVFCEVKTRSSTKFGAPFEAVTATKQRRLRTLAARWLAEHDARRRTLRFDVASVTRTANGELVVDVLEGAF